MSKVFCVFFAFDSERVQKEKNKILTEKVSKGKKIQLGDSKDRDEKKSSKKKENVKIAKKISKTIFSKAKSLITSKKK